MKFSATKDFAKWFWVTRGTNIILQKWVEPAKFVAVISQNFFLQNNGCCKISANASHKSLSAQRLTCIVSAWLSLKDNFKLRTGDFFPGARASTTSSALPDIFARPEVTKSPDYFFRWTGRVRFVTGSCSGATSSEKRKAATKTSKTFRNSEKTLAEIKKAAGFESPVYVSRTIENLSSVVTSLNSTLSLIKASRSGPSDYYTRLDLP